MDCLPPPANKNFRKMTEGGMEGETERERRKGKGRREEGQ